MSPQLTPLSLLLLTAVVLGGVVSIICFTYRSNQRSATQFLSLSMFSLTVCLFICFMLESGLIFKAIHFFHFNFLTTLIYMPSSYLFVRGIVTGERVTARDCIHFIPAFIFLVDYHPIFLLSGEEKENILHENGLSGYYFLNGLFIPVDVRLLVRFLLFITYSVLQFRIIRKNQVPARSWLSLYVKLQSLLIVSYVVNSLWPSHTWPWAVGVIILSVYLILITVSLLFSPSTLYTLNEHALVDKSKPDVKQPGIEKEQLSPHRIHLIGVRLQEFMDIHSPYLQAGYSIQQLSSSLQFPAYQVSIYLNRYLGLSFTDYLNKRRVEYATKRIKELDYHVAKLETIAYDCGFNNRNSFTVAFKRFTGCTPSEYIRMRKEAPMNTCQ